MSKQILRWALIAAALGVSIAATAGTLATTPNTEGGHIALTDVRCRNNNSYDSWVAYTRVPDGRTQFGCWAYESSDNMVYVLWSNTGDLRLYDWGGFSFTAYGQSVYSRSKQTTGRTANNM